MSIVDCRLSIKDRLLTNALDDGPLIEKDSSLRSNLGDANLGRFMRIKWRFSAATTAAILLLLAGCTRVIRTDDWTFSEDVAFLDQHTDVIVLGRGGAAQIAVVPQYQGRVMTSTVGGYRAAGNGWINRKLIAANVIQPHINVFGGEDRFWMGPEGGQFAIFFKPGDAFDLDHWQTPAVIDTEPYEVVDQTSRSLAFRKRAQLANYSGTTFNVKIDRVVRLLDDSDLSLKLSVTRESGVKVVAYETENTITNIGDSAWTRAGGLLSIWILGMFKHSARTTVVVPFRSGPEQRLGPIVNDAYFGTVPSYRLKIGDGVLFFSGDGKYRSKIGVNPRRARPLLGSYDATRGVLTIVQYTLPRGASAYVNSMWELQEHPFAGDVVNSYNDGPTKPGQQPLGPFYEIESSSPAAALAPEQSITHVHRTYHFTGPRERLNRIASSVLGVGLDEIEAALN